MADCLAIVEAVKKLPAVEPKSVVVFGHSGGAAETSLAAIKELGLMVFAA